MVHQTTNQNMIDLDLQFASNYSSIPSADQFQQWVEQVLKRKEINRTSAELTIRVVDEAEIQELNHTYRGKNKPTNVISFPFEKPEHIEIPLLGDLIVCAPIVQQEALAQSKSELSHWAHMTIHGTLHLLGYDHIQDSEAEEMEGLEIEILNELGYDNPYLQEAD